MNISVFSNNPIGENCYGVDTNDGIVIIDPGFFTKALEKYINENAERVKYILITHAHFDHICALPQVLKKCKNAKSVVHSLDKEGLVDPKISLANRFGIKQEPINADIIIDNENEAIIMGNTEIRFVHTPGHTIGSVCYIIDNAMFSGDTLFKLSYGRTDFPQGDSATLKKSLIKLKNIEYDYTVYPGHGESTTLFFEKDNNSGMIE